MSDTGDFYGGDMKPYLSDRNSCLADMQMQDDADCNENIASLCREIIELRAVIRYALKEGMGGMGDVGHEFARRALKAGIEDPS